jgi:hypothetical protein
MGKILSEETAKYDDTIELKEKSLLHLAELFIRS